MALVPLGREGLPVEIPAVLRMRVSGGGAYVCMHLLHVNGRAQH